MISKQKLSHNFSTWKDYRRAFFTALCISALFFLPFILAERGYFFYLGDFNVQQIPFYRLAHQAVRDGAFGWNWHTDLGSSFIPSYSFYLLGSPFFWLTIPFPNNWVPMMIAPLLCLKFACMAVTSLAYIKRFVKNSDYAFIGSMLYTFSGFSVYNIFYNHFHDVMVFFPLLLLGLEMVVIDKKRGLFAAAIAINALVNYFFFVGQVTFVIIYFFCRVFTSKEFRITFKTFFCLAIEAILGFGMSLCLLLPSVLGIMDNPRINWIGTGWNFWLYGNNQRILSIIQAFLFPPELPPFLSFFPDASIRWVSVAGWLPLFGMIGVLAYIKDRKHSFIRPLLLICALCAFVPGLNSAFFLFKNSYYARWFYMPILIMALATCHALEDEKADWKWGWNWTAFATIGMLIILTFTPKQEDGEWILGLFNYTYWPTYISAAAIALACLFAVHVIIQKRGQPGFSRKLALLLCGLCFIYPLIHISEAKTTSGINADYVIDDVIGAKDDFDLPIDAEGEGFWRIDLLNGMDNLGMFLGYPNLQAFHSVVSNSILEFYPEVGVKRDVSSKPDQSHYWLRGLLSVKYLFVRPDGNPEQVTMPGFSYVDTQHLVDIYRNENYIPMGFTYDQYISEEMLMGFSTTSREKILLQTISLNEEQIAKYGHLIPEYESGDGILFDEASYVQACDERRASACSSFAVDTKGFTATINSDSGNLVFFSIPYDKGWSATVNGEPVPVEKVNIAFMAVEIPAGESEIRFVYTTPGLKIGTFASLVCLVLWILYLILFAHFSKMKKENDDVIFSQNKPVRAHHLSDESQTVSLLPPGGFELFEDEEETDNNGKDE